MEHCYTESNTWHIYFYELMHKIAVESIHKTFLPAHVAIANSRTMLTTNHSRSSQIGSDNYPFSHEYRISNDELIFGCSLLACLSYVS